MNLSHSLVAVGQEFHFLIDKIASKYLELVSPLGQTVFVQQFLSQMTQIQQVISLVMVDDTLVLV
jgi:CII-binding regulator of phage lambda lysogenization HflD